MPTPIAVYFGSDNLNNAIVLGPFTPTAGEYWTVLSASWDTANPTGTPTGGGQTYTAKKTAAPGGFNGYARIDECTVSGSPGSMSVTVPAPAGNTRHSATLIRWPVGCTGGAVNATVSGAGAPSANVTTTAANSGIAQVSTDVASQDPAGRAYRNSAVEAGVLDGHVGANSVQYHAYVPDIGAAGTYAIGLTAPGSQTWVLAAVEVLAAGGTVHSVNATDAAGLTDTAALGLGRAVTDSAGLTDPYAASGAKPVTDLAGLTDTATLAASKAVTDTAGLTDTWVLSGAQVVVDDTGLTDPASLSGSRAFALTDSVGLTDGAVVSPFTPGGASAEWSAGQPRLGWQADNVHTGWSAANPRTGWSAGNVRAGG